VLEGLNREFEGDIEIWIGEEWSRFEDVVEFDEGGGAGPEVVDGFGED
jgi:hypothetical protein